MLTSLPKLNRSKEVKEFKSSVGPRCTLVNLARAGKKSPLPAVCPSPLEEVRSLPRVCLNRTDHANVPYQCQQKARGRPNISPASSPVSTVSLPQRDRAGAAGGAAPPGIANGFQTTVWDFWSSHFCCRLLTTAGNNCLSKSVTLYYAFSSNTPLSPHPQNGKDKICVLTWRYINYLLIQTAFAKPVATLIYFKLENESLPPATAVYVSTNKPK